MRSFKDIIIENRVLYGNANEPTRYRITIVRYL